MLSFHLLYAAKTVLAKKRQDLIHIFIVFLSGFVVNLRYRFYLV